MSFFGDSGTRILEEALSQRGKGFSNGDDPAATMLANLLAALAPGVISKTVPEPPSKGNASPLQIGFRIGHFYDISYTQDDTGKIYPHKRLLVKCFDDKQITFKFGGNNSWTIPRTDIVSASPSPEPKKSLWQFPQGTRSQINVFGAVHDVYRCKSDDTLAEIARKFELAVKDLQTFNAARHPDMGKDDTNAHLCAGTYVYLSPEPSADADADADFEVVVVRAVKKVVSPDGTAVYQMWYGRKFDGETDKVLTTALFAKYYQKQMFTHHPDETKTASQFMSDDVQLSYDYRSEIERWPGRRVLVKRGSRTDDATATACVQTDIIGLARTGIRISSSTLR